MIVFIKHNILLDDLTCAQHLRVFGRLKGIFICFYWLVIYLFIYILQQTKTNKLILPLGVSEFEIENAIQTHLGGSRPAGQEGYGMSSPPPQTSSYSLLPSSSLPYLATLCIPFPLVYFYILNIIVVIYGAERWNETQAFCMSPSLLASPPPPCPPPCPPLMRISGGYSLYWRIATYFPRCMYFLYFCIFCFILF